MSGGGVGRTSTIPTKQMAKFERQLASTGQAIEVSFVTAVLSWVFYATAVQLIWMFWPLPFPTSPVAASNYFQSPIDTACLGS